VAVTVSVFTRVTVADTAMDADSTAPARVIERSVTGLARHVDLHTVVNNTTVTLWSSTASPLTTFSFLAAWSDGEVELELTCNDGDANEAIFTVELQNGIPFMLGSDDSRYNPGSVSGSADVIDLIRVKNGAATDVNVYLILAV